MRASMRMHLHARRDDDEEHTVRDRAEVARADKERVLDEARERRELPHHQLREARADFVHRLVVHLHHQHAGRPRGSRTPHERVERAGAVCEMPQGAAALVGRQGG